MDLSQLIHDRLTLNPAARAFDVGGVWNSWGDVHTLVQRIDAVLDEAGIGDTSPVGLIGRNRLLHFAAMLAIFRRGRTTVCIHSLLPPDGLAAEIRNLRLPVIIADQEDWASAVVTDAARDAGTVGVSLSDRAEKITLVPGLERLGPGSHRADNPDTAIEILTSGTTGLPKRIPISWNTVNLSMEDARQVLAQNYATAKADAPPPIRVHYVPLGNMSGVWQLLATVADGYPSVVFEKFDIPRWVETIRQYRPNYIGLVPAAAKMVYDANVSEEVFSSASVLSVGGAKLDPEFQRRFEKRYNVIMLTTYGATEFFGAIAAWSVEDRRHYGDSKLSSAGRARSGINLRIIHPETSEILPAGETGLLEVQVERTGPEWTRTTDLASLDEDGFLYIHGRADGAISRGGFKMHPQEIVQILCSHPDIADASVVGMPDERLGEVPVAAVELIPDAGPLTVADLDAFARKHLVPYKVPVKFVIVDRLPRTPSLKVSMPQVRALFAA